MLKREIDMLMWDSLLYAVNMFYYCWLVKKLFLPMAEQNKARQEIRTELYIERVGRVKKT